jgi:hypothetical protein
VLSGRLAAHDVADLEALVCRVITDSLRRYNTVLDERRRNELVCDLLATAWEVGQRYDPSVGVSFATYAYRTLCWRFVDWLRGHLGNNRHGPLPTVLSLEREFEVDDGESDSPSRIRLDAALASFAGDPAADCDPELRRVLEQDDREDLGILGQARSRAHGRAA